MDALVSPFTQESGLLFEDLNRASPFPAAGAALYKANLLPLSNHDFSFPFHLDVPVPGMFEPFHVDIRTHLQVDFVRVIE